MIFLLSLIIISASPLKAEYEHEKVRICMKGNNMQECLRNFDKSIYGKSRTQRYTYKANKNKGPIELIVIPFEK
tara:strand:- start:633 stop:854 length:222 start_codon:yes stop_codon:yes gene_type:complete